MFDYEQFKYEMEAGFHHYLPERYRNGEVTLQVAHKTNGDQDALSVKIPTDEGFSVSPLIYIAPLYERYRECEDFDQVAREAANLFVEHYEKAPINMETFNIEDARNSMFMALINTERNKEILAIAPHREVEDMSIVYKWKVSNMGDCCATSLINNAVAERLGMSEQELFENASRCMAEDNPVVIRDMKDVLIEMMGPDMDPEMAEMLVEMENPMPMLVVSNQSKMFGAYASTMPEILQKIAEKLGGDFFVLPSSIHETIAVPAGPDTRIEDLRAMVKEVNETQVAPDEYLSDNVYFYDHKLQKFMIADAQKIDAQSEGSMDTPSEDNQSRGRR